MKSIQCDLDKDDLLVRTVDKAIQCGLLSNYHVPLVDTVASDTHLSDVNEVVQCNLSHAYDSNCENVHVDASCSTLLEFDTQIDIDKSICEKTCSQLNGRSSVIDNVVKPTSSVSSFNAEKCYADSDTHNIEMCFQWDQLPQRCCKKSMPCSLCVVEAKEIDWFCDDSFWSVPEDSLANVAANREEPCDIARENECLDTSDVCDTPRTIPIFSVKHVNKCNICSQTQSAQSQVRAMLDICDKVANSGVPNAFGCRISVPSHLNISTWREKLRGFPDHEVVEFLEFWVANRLYM